MVGWYNVGAMAQGKAGTSKRKLEKPQTERELLHLDLHDARLLAHDLLDERAEPLDGALGARHRLLDLLSLSGALLKRGAEPLAEVPPGEAEHLARLARDALGVRGRKCRRLLGARGRRRRERGLELAPDVARERAGEVVDEVGSDSDCCERGNRLAAKSGVGARTTH